MPVLTPAPSARVLPLVGSSSNTKACKVGPGLDPAGLADALERHAEALAEILIPDLRGLDAAAVFETGTLRIERVEPADGTGVHRLHFRFEWSAQHGCSDWSCRETEFRSGLFRYVGDQAVFEVSPAPEERTTREEF
jgi:hypothetical protein